MTITQRKFNCPKCGARLIKGERFCIDCGVNLTWVTGPIQTQATLYSDQYPSQLQKVNQARPIYDQQARGNRQPGLNDDSFSSKKNSSIHRTAAPISTEITKLLAAFEKHLKYNKVS